MKPVTQEWIDKAESDWTSAQREARARKSPNYDLACYCTQQCAEKYLKAKLVEAGLAFKRTHDLEALLALALPLEPGWSTLQLELKYLSDFSSDYRYPGFLATKVQAQNAIKSCRKVREVVRQSFSLPA